MKSGERTALIASVIVLAALGVYVALKLSIKTDITQLLPAGSDRTALALTRQVADSELARSMALTLAAADGSALPALSREFEAELRKQPGVRAQLAALDAGPQPDSERSVYELYHPRRLAFFAADPEHARAQLTAAALSRAAQHLKQQLSQPMSTLLSRLAPSDPLLSLISLFERVQGAQGNALRVEDGRFLTQDGRYAVFFLRSHARAFDSTAQAPLLQGIAAAFAKTNARHAGKLTLDQSGVNRFAVRAEQMISADMTQVSVLSTLGLGALMFLLFRSFRLLALASIPLGAGTLAGMAACLAVHGSVHGVTLAFGASLLGVALDYVEHLYCHQAVAPDPAGPGATLRHIGPALITGALTTLVGFMALGGSGFRGLEEVALFSSAGLIAALITTFTMLPALMPKTTTPVPMRDRIVARLGHLFDALRARRKLLWLFPATALAISAVGLPRVRMGSDFMLGQLDADLLAEDQRVRERVARFDQTRFIVSLADSEQAALQVNDAVAQTLAAAVQRGEVGGFQSVAQLLPSAARQAAVEQAVRASLGDGSALVQAFVAEGFRAEALAPFVASLKAPQPAPLSYTELTNSPLAGLVRPFRITLGSQVAFITFLHGVKAPRALAAELESIPGARFVNQQPQLRAAYLAYQQRTLQLVLVGTGLVLLLLAVRYRDLRKTVAAFAPSLLGASVTVAVLGFCGRPLNLVALAALLMVVSMGVDYGVFLVDASDDATAPTIALLSVFLAATTTVLGFGLLALSRHPLLSVIGLTAFIGMTVCALLAPTTLVLLGRTTPSPSPQELAHDA